MKRSEAILAMTIGLLGGTASAALAGPYTVSRVSFSGGQTSSVAGSYRLTGGAGTPLVQLSSGGTYLLQSGFWALPPSGTTDVGPVESAPRATRWLHGAPNPFGSNIQLAFELATRNPVSLEVFDLRGARVRALVHESLEAGRYQIAWDGRAESGAAVPAGIYWIQFQAGGTRERSRVVRLP